MIVHIIYYPDKRYWGFWHYDSQKFKTTVEGFKDHITAELKAKELLGEDVKIIHK